MNTQSPKASANAKVETTKNAVDEASWHLIDANGETLGRLASRIATLLMGKHKPTYSPHMDMGDHVVVVNAEKVRLTGRKAEQKVYYRHTGYPGSIRSTSIERMLADHPERVLQKAVRGMLPHNILGREMFRKLRVYAGPDHRHGAQQPQPLDI